MRDISIGDGWTFPEKGWGQGLPSFSRFSSLVIYPLHKVKLRTHCRISAKLLWLKRNEYDPKHIKDGALTPDS